MYINNIGEDKCRLLTDQSMVHVNTMRGYGETIEGVNDEA